MCFYIYDILYAEEWNQLLIVWKLMLVNYMKQWFYSNA